MAPPSPQTRDGSYGHRWRGRLSQWLDQHAITGSATLLITALIVGASAGLGAVIFRWLIQGVQTLAYEGLGEFLEAIAPFHLLVIPALGGAVFGPLTYLLAQETKGPGVSEVMEAVALRGGRIRPRVAIVKLLVSSICIGTGGSAGRQGPIVQIGSSLGSTVGQVLNLSDERVRTLVACGAAGGVAVTFNAPIAGSIFALEVILGQLQTVYFGAVIISAVTADVVAHALSRDLSAFVVPEYTLVSPWELALYTLLGGLAAVAAASFSRLLYLSQDWWDELRVPEYLKPAAGGVLLGVVGILTFKVDGFPRVFGVGQDSVSEALLGQLTLRVALPLLFVKMFATVLTLGSGGSGGIFGPSLFMGAMLGEAFGQIAQGFFPTITAPAGAYALVGMAAFFGGATHAPATAILILFEMTANYSIILPLMLATVMSALISNIISHESIYTRKLSRRGVHLQQGQDIDVMQGVTVGEVMTTDVVAVPLSTSLEELTSEFAGTHHHGFAVLDSAGELTGVVSIRDLERALEEGPIIGKTVADIATTEGLLVAYPQEPMGTALRRLGARDVGRLPVVERAGSRRLVGMVHRSDIIHAYNQALAKRALHQQRVEALRLGRLDDTSFVSVAIPPQSPVVGRRVSQVHLPQDCLIVSVRRGRKLHIAHGYTILQAGDQVTVLTDDACKPLLRRRLTGEVREGEDQERLGARHREFTIPPGAVVSGRRVRDLSLPPNCILVSVQRGDEVIVPHGDTTLQAGDVVEIFGLEEELDAAESCLSQ